MAQAAKEKEEKE